MQRINGIAETVKQGFFFDTAPFVRFVSLIFPLFARDGNDDFAGFRRQMLVESGFVEQAAFLVEGDDCASARWLRQKSAACPPCSLISYNSFR